MVRFDEGKAEQNLITIELLPLINKYKKPSAKEDDVNQLVQQVAAVLDMWDYNHKEIKALDRKAFLDLMKSYYLYLKNSSAKALFSRVFAL